MKFYFARSLICALIMISNSAMSAPTEFIKTGNFATYIEPKDSSYGACSVKFGQIASRDLTVNVTYSKSMFILFLEAVNPIFVEGAGITNVYFGQNLRIMNWESGGKFLTIMNSNPEKFLNMPNSDIVRMAMLKPGSLKEGGEILINAPGLATAINDAYQCFMPVYREKKRKLCAELPEYTRKRPESTCAEVELNK